MASGFGLSYQPGAENAPGREGQGRNGGAKRTSPQEAVKLLKLRVPERANPTAPISRALMTSPGGAAPGASALMQMVQQLRQGVQPSAPMGSPMVPPLSGRMPAPGPLPEAIDNGMSGGGVRGPQMPRVQPNPAPVPQAIDNGLGGDVRDPRMPTVQPNPEPLWPSTGQPEVPLAPTAPPPPRVIPGIDNTAGIDAGAWTGDQGTRTAEPEPPSLFDEAADLPWWMQKKADSLFGSGPDVKGFDGF